MLTPKSLKSGDKVGIISTARKISEVEIQPAIDKLNSWGLEVVKGKYLHETYSQFAGTIKQRSRDFQAMINDKSIKAIFCARGGYGTVQIVDNIDWAELQRNPKWIIGYSDVTVLHSHIQRHVNMESLHAIMPINFPKDGECNSALNSLKSALFNNSNNYSFPSHKFNKLGSIQAPINGGNLSILYSLLGSKSEVKSRNGILFIEDLDEYIYHIDRMMMNLLRNDKLMNIKALVIGGMSDMNDNDIPYGENAIEIINRIVEPYNYPVCYNFPAGHIADNRAIIMGRNTLIEIKEKETLFIQA